MALNRSTLMIRDYENIRRILREIYIFGCFTKDDYIEMGFSGRKVDKEQQRIGAYLPDKFIKKRRVNKKVIQYCRYNISDSTRNYLAETYRNKSFTMLDILSYFYVLQILSDGQERTLQEILEDMPFDNAEIEFTKDNLRVKLDELLENQFIQIHRGDRSVKYLIADDIWQDYSDEELLELLTYLEFIKNVSPVEIPYYFLQRKLKLYLFSERKIRGDDRSPFQFKHSHIFNSLDNDILIVCLRAIQEKTSLVIEKDGGKAPLTALPIKIIHDSTYGRQYLMFYNVKLQLMNAVRIDHIKSIQIGKKFSEDEQRTVNANRDFDKSCWNMSGINDDPQEVLVEFCFDEQKENYILNRLLREGHGGAITKQSDGVFHYRIALRDPKEIIPWIRSFGERARVISSGDFRIEQTIEEDWDKAVKKYESISRV